MHEACEDIRGLSLDSEFVDTGIKHVNRYLRISPKMTCYLASYMERLKAKISLSTVRYMEPCAKAMFHKTGVYDSVAHFDVGNLATLLIYDAVGIDRGKWTADGCIDDNAFRIKNSCRKSGEYM